MANRSGSGILVRSTLTSRSGDWAAPFRLSRLASLVVSTLGEPSPRVVRHPASSAAVASNRRGVANRMTCSLDQNGADLWRALARGGSPAYGPRRFAQAGSTAVRRGPVAQW